MQKTRQQELIRWLKKQSVIGHHWLKISSFLGLLCSLLIIIQAWLLAGILENIIVECISSKALVFPFMILFLIFILRALVLWLRERVALHAASHIRRKIRRQVLDKLEAAGPPWIQSSPTGNWTTLVLEQIDDMHDYYARYLSQTVLAVYVPLLIAISILPTNWIAALILVLTAPLIPIFIALIGIKAADANRRNFLALARLSGYFLDRLRGMETLRLFDRSKIEIKNIRLASQNFRHRTMEVLRIAFLSSGVLEFFISSSIAFIGMYFGFSYLSVIDFGHYKTSITLSSGFLSLILAPEFFQPLRDLGAFYHAKAQAIGAADSLKNFLETPLINPEHGKISLSKNKPLTLVAENFSILSVEGIVLVGPLNFTLSSGQRVALVGPSGSGKSSLLNALSGFMPYTGSLRINGTELRVLDPDSWHSQLSWVGQNPQLPAATLRDNILLGYPNARESELQSALDRAWVSEFLPLLTKNIETVIGDQGIGLSVGQAQRVAIARALLRPCQLLLLDEPAASLDRYSEKRIMKALHIASLQQTTLMVTHHLEEISDWDSIWVLNNGHIVEKGDFNTLLASQGYFATLLANYQKRIIPNAYSTAIFDAL